jgi:hypothetical protein
MKKVLAIVLSISILFTLTSSLLFGGTVNMRHSVASVSNFKLNAKSVTKFEDSNAIEIADISIKNNTRDGYRVTLQATSGVLAPNTSADGEEAIAYTLSSTPLNGPAPANTNSAFQQLDIPAKPGTDAHVILGIKTGVTLDTSTLLNTPTDASFTLSMNVDSDEFIDMAGSYSDVITIAYTDL